ncbi:MAG: phosphate signaling complex protein PhoU [Clostridiales bacterium]|uniref:phosphate signaling complex protein PhoU n=1 Tax=Clostridium sp. N3C TaxID=1776758 RepID=UPI00092DFB5F|nr:phosphate signaling complex protein PhoU [Clostridium sp. N3C]NLZ49123.1 phosphate signaling complex protein PhoU [Clostridiales bacterium]SCN22086.1 Phosphate uptake regulator [Clostridium sp. N3C]
MIRSAFDNHLQKLHNEIVKMGDLVENQIHLSIESLVQQDEKLANAVISNDDFVDELQKTIDNKSIRLIAMQHPLAKDLRNIFTAIKIATDLERMADHAVDIAKIAKALIKEKYIKELIDIPQMAIIVKKFVRESLNSYLQADLKKAYETVKIDHEIDAIYDRVFSELLDLMIKGEENINQIAQFLFVCKYLERVADHATNICESTIYVVTGELIDLND